jgi:hypothetical protein
MGIQQDMNSGSLLQIKILLHTRSTAVLEPGWQEYRILGYNFKNDDLLNLKNNDFVLFLGKIEKTRNAYKDKPFYKVFYKNRICWIFEDFFELIK